MRNPHQPIIESLKVKIEQALTLFDANKKLEIRRVYKVYRLVEPVYGELVKILDDIFSILSMQFSQQDDLYPDHVRRELEEVKSLIRQRYTCNDKLAAIKPTLYGSSVAVCTLFALQSRGDMFSAVHTDMMRLRSFEMFQKHHSRLINLLV